MNTETDLSVSTYGTGQVTDFVHNKLTPVQTGPGAHQASYKMGIGSFSRGKAAGA